MGIPVEGNSGRGTGGLAPSSTVFLAKGLGVPTRVPLFSLGIPLREHQLLHGGNPLPGGTEVGRPIVSHPPELPNGIFIVPEKGFGGPMGLVGRAAEVAEGIHRQP